MDPILRIIHYLFQKIKFENNDDTFNSFFNNGVAFPMFVAIAFDVEEIPGIIKTPETITQKNKNNKIALQYLFDHNKSIGTISPNYETDQDKIQLLSLILTKQCFQIDIQSIINECNQIIKPLKIHFNTKAEFISSKCILSLLNVFTDGKVPIITETSDFDALMKKSFDIAKAPLVIDKTSIETQNRFIFYIQIEILLDFYCDKVNQMLFHISNKFFSDFESSSEDLKTTWNDNNTSKLTNSDSDDSSKDKLSDLNLSNMEDSKNSEISELSDINSSFDDDIDERNNIDQKNDEKEEEIIPVTNIENDNMLHKNLFGSLKIRENDQFELENLFNKKLLEVINGIENTKFETFQQAVEDDEIPKFVVHVLGKSIKNVNLEQTKEAKKDEFLSKSELKNIKNVLNYLKKKEPKFKVLLFDFKSPKFIESSTILFYRTFIKYFFLKNSYEELFERCVTLTYDKIINKKDIDDHNKILTNWRIYAILINFIKEKKLNAISIGNFWSIAEGYFKSTNIPLLVNPDFLKTCSNQKKLPISIYCQLKFIFNRIDEIGGSYHVIEILKFVTRKIKQMNVPKSDKLASNIRAKNLSLILQKKSYKHYVIQKEIQKDISIDDDIENESLKNKPLPPDPFDSRDHTLEIKTQLENFLLSKKKVESAESFWNPPDECFSFDNGILYNDVIHDKRKKKSLHDWINEMSVIKKSVNKIKTETFVSSNQDKTKQSIKKYTSTNIKSRLYKFFIFNENKNKWEYNMDIFYTFSRDKKISINEMKTPLVLFINSYEEDLKNIAINLKLLIGEYPDLDDDQIYIYGLGDRSFSSNIETNQMIKPIFLLLHVPEKMKKLPNISTIIFQIYSFLCFICDIEIVVLNKNYYNDQIDIVKKINNISLGYQQKNQVEILSESHLLSASNSSDEENEIIEDESNESYSEREEDKKDAVDVENDIDDNFIKIGKNICKRKRKILFLFNDECEKYSSEIEQRFYKSTFFSNMKLDIDSFIHIKKYINTNDPNSYRSFISKFTDLVFDNDNSVFDDVSRNFRFIRLSEISSKYIKLKNDQNWEQNLNELINKRFMMLKKYDVLNSQYLTILDNLRKEIITNSPSFDLEFKNKCYLILSEIKKKESQDNRKYFISEMENSSRLNLEYLKKVIENELYWKNEDKENIICNHIQFLKDEFFNIIKMLYEENLFKPIYEENKDILYDQIKKDTDIIQNEYFHQFTDAELLKQTKKKIDINYQKKRGTNYSIRESENTREIKVTVQINDDLTSKIKQDF